MTPTVRVITVRLDFDSKIKQLNIYICVCVSVPVAGRHKQRRRPGLKEGRNVRGKKGGREGRKERRENLEEGRKEGRKEGGQGNDEGRKEGSIHLSPSLCTPASFILYTSPFLPLPFQDQSTC